MSIEARLYLDWLIARVVQSKLYFSERHFLHRAQVTCPGSWLDEAWWALEVLSASPGPAGLHLNALVAGEDEPAQFDRLRAQGAIGKAYRNILAWPSSTACAPRGRGSPRWRWPSCT